MSKEKKNEKHRITDGQLNDVCLDCCDFLSYCGIRCDNCPVFRLKRSN